MPKVKVPRKSTAMDMTAMCDVAFLLLTFFMLTTKFKPPELAPIDLPSSRAEIKIPDKNVMLISVTEQGKVFFGLDNKKIRARTLERMEAALPGVSFSADDKKAFSLMEEFGVPFQQLPAICKLDNAGRIAAQQQGVPVDSTQSKFNKNELGEWIYSARMAEQELRQAGELIDSEGLFICLKGSGSANYETVKKIITTFTERKINKFNIITTMEGGGVVSSESPPASGSH